MGYLSVALTTDMTLTWLLQRFEMTEEVYALYEQAAQIQNEEPKRFAKLLTKAAARLEGHLNDFPPVEQYLTEARKELGLDQSSILRVQATKKNIKLLADFLRFLTASDRPLPTFVQLQQGFLQVSTSRFWASRENEWALGPARFRRYSIQSSPWEGAAANPDKE